MERKPIYVLYMTLNRYYIFLKKCGKKREKERSGTFLHFFPLSQNREERTPQNKMYRLC